MAYIEVYEFIFVKAVIPIIHQTPPSRMHIDPYPGGDDLM
jgi:hypothetical protein